MSKFTDTLKLMREQKTIGASIRVLLNALHDTDDDEEWKSLHDEVQRNPSEVEAAIRQNTPDEKKPADETPQDPTTPMEDTEHVPEGTPAPKAEDEDEAADSDGGKKSTPKGRNK